MHAMESRVLLRTFCVILGLGAVWGLGVDPSLQIDVLTELELGESTDGVRQVPGLHNGTKAFLFQESPRSKDGCRNGGACIAANVCACPQGFTGPSCETDIDECSEGFVQCDSRANCINLPGWYHCECRDGYHDNGMFAPGGESCEDIDECGTGRHSCTNDTICFNLDGGYDCRCPHGKNCTGDCVHEGKVKHTGQIWVLENDITKTCLDEMNVVRFTGSSWIKHGTECTLCQCKNGHLCCSVDPQCLQEL